MVVFSDKAYNGIIRESFAKHPVETGGILLGHILDNGLWIVMEMVPPGINCVHEVALFEYDRDFVNYLGTSIANQYKKPLQVLGLWHRHPGAMDYFSSTDDITNGEFAQRSLFGTISGLVNIDPKLRLTMYYLPHLDTPRAATRVAYAKVSVEVGDDLIPEEYFELRYIDSARSNLNPIPTVSSGKATLHRVSLQEELTEDGAFGENAFEIPSNKKVVEGDVLAEKTASSSFRKFICVALIGVVFGVLLGFGVSRLSIIQKSDGKVEDVVTTDVRKTKSEPRQIPEPDVADHPSNNDNQQDGHQ